MGAPPPPVEQHAPFTGDGVVRLEADVSHIPAIMARMMRLWSCLLCFRLPTLLLNWLSL